MGMRTYITDMSEEKIEELLKKNGFSRKESSIYGNEIIEIISYYQKGRIFPRKVILEIYRFPSGGTLTKITTNVKGLESIIPKREEDATSWIDLLYPISGFILGYY